jgi:SSS family solute:Na+ symporter
VLFYITLGGLSSAIYNEVLQFFVIMAGLVPLTLVGLKAVGGWSGLQDKISGAKALGPLALHPWQGTGVGSVTNPIGANWIAIVFGLGFVLSFGYWTTNFAEVQRALAAKNLSAARRTPLIGAFPKLLIPFVVVIPGLIAAVTVQGLGAKTGDLQFNNAIPILISKYLPTGMLGIAITGLLAAFMAGVAANVTAFNTVVSYDLWQAYVRKDEPDQYYVRFGRIATVVGVVIAIGTAFIAAGYNSMMDYIQALFSFFNAPLFATFIIAMFWRRATAWAGFWGLAAGTLAAVATHFLHSRGPLDLGSPLSADFWGAVAAFVVDAVVTVAVSLATRPKPDDELRGLVWGLTRTEDATAERDPAERVWWRRPAVLGAIALAITALLYLVFLF